MKSVLLHKGVFLHVIVLMMTVVSCHDIETELLPDDDIHLQASIASSVLVAKGQGVVSSSFEDPLYMGFVRIDETASGYPDDFKGQPALTATMQGASDIKDIEFNENYQTFRSEKYGVRYASWYPWYEKASEETSGAYKYNPETGKVTFPIDGSTDILYGSLVTGTKAKGFNTIVYDHALVKYRVKAYALVPYDENKKPIESYLPDVLWGNIQTVSLQGMPSECHLCLPVEGKVDYLLEWPDGNIKDYNVTGEDGQPLLSSIPIIMDQAATVTEILAAPPVDGVLKINVKTSNTSATQQITIARDFKPGRSYDIRLRFSSHGLINADVEVSEWVEGDDVNVQTGGKVFFDLSSTSTANCYMISSANYNYCFDVTVKGNGAGGVLDGLDYTLAPGYIDVIWMDQCLDGKFELSSHYPSQGRALFSLKGNDDENVKVIPAEMEGNVLIGAYKDSSKKELLWTWHLWICDHPQIQSYKNGFTVQDRDLGAIDYTSTTNARVDGLYYQWGRPTPFPVNRTLAEDEDFTIKSSDGSLGVNAAVSYPDTFYKDAVIAEDGKTYRLWGWRSAADEYVKTIYDPCPAGYRVPSKRLWAELKADNYLIDKHNVRFSVIDGYDVYYPISGYYNGPTEGVKYYWDGSTARQDKVGAFMWSATYDEDEDNPYLMTYEYQKDGAHSMTTRPAKDDGPALPVRCVAERSTPHVEDLSAFQTANSYIVDEAGYYKFNAGVRGNGVGYLVSPGSSDYINLTAGLNTKIDVAFVDYLWWQGDMETKNAEPEPPVIIDFDGEPDEKGYVTFHIDQYKKGNLILAGYDEKGVILWTWHLWLTDTPAMKKSKDYEVMDRFLGATYAPPAVSAESVGMSDDQWNATIGFYYQWGRKDPFPTTTGKAGDDGTSPMAKWWKYDRLLEKEKWIEYDDFYRKAVNAGRSIPMSVKEPMTFHYTAAEFPSLGVTSTSFSTFFSEDKNIANRCFGDVTEVAPESLWGYSSATGFGKTTTKTMYDPCPPGYSVAYYLVWAGGSMFDSYTYYDGWSWNVSSTEVSKEKGLMLSPDRFGNLYDYTWYPYTGYIDAHSAEYKEVGTVGRFYSSTPASNGSRSFFYDQSYTGQAVVDFVGISTTFALPVRCQKD